MNTGKESLYTGLEIKSAQCALNIFRAVRSSHHGHIGGALSALDIITALYFYKMNVDPQNPTMAERDRFILSAGHKCLALYGVLAEKGFFNKRELDTYGKIHTRLPGHPDMHKLPGVEANTGALGHGLSIATGMAIAMKADQNPAKVYVVMGDGELPEGSNWEAAAAAAHYHLDNLVVFVDNNGLQIGGKVENIMNMTPISQHFAAFGWETREIDGHDMRQLVDVLDSVPLAPGKPTLVAAHTIKSKGLSFAENKLNYHYWTATDDQLKTAEEEFTDRIESLRHSTLAAVI